MKAVEKRVDSIAQQLLRRLLVGGLLLGLLLAVAVAWLARGLSNDLLDYQLEQVARVLIDHDFSRLDVPLVEDPAAHLSVQVLDKDGTVIYRSGEGLRLQRDTPPGFSSVRGAIESTLDGDPNDDLIKLRVFTLRSAQRTVQVAHPRDLRQELAFDAGVQVLLPIAAVILALVVLTVSVVRKGMQPLQRLREELQSRDAQTLTPVQLAGAPLELSEPLEAINGLMARLESALQAHRRFIADASHQLRTPLAAVRLQADRLAQAEGLEAREEAQLALDAGLDRLTRLVEQLLALARLENSNAAALAHTPVDLVSLAADALVDVAMLATQRGIELSLETEGKPMVHADAHAIRMLLDNLLDNAIKYSPPNTSVIVQVLAESGRAALWVEDQGPGLTEDERVQLTQRFLRGTNKNGHTEVAGSGLGLAIAAEAALRHGVHLQLLPGQGARGLRAGVDGLELAWGNKPGDSGGNG